jgi:hypothetical protein
VVLRNDKFVRAANGSPVRFFGANLAFGASFPEPQDAARIAKRLRRLGVNLVRLHHMDTSPDSNPETARSILTTGPYPTLNPVAVCSALVKPILRMADQLDRRRDRSTRWRFRDRSI